MKAGSQSLIVVCVALVSASEGRAAELVISTSGAPVVLGTHRTVTISLEATGEGADELEGLQVACSVGEVSVPRAAGPRRWDVTYHPPVGNSPRFAIFLASAGNRDAPVVGTLVVPLLGRADLPVRTEAGARVTVSVAGRTFGPVTAGADGLARIEIEVPPGIDAVTAHSIDPIGNEVEREVPLDVPDAPRIVVLAPSRAEAGARATGTVFAIDQRGTPHERLEVGVSRGELTTRVGPGSSVVFELVMPQRLGRGSVDVVVRCPGDVTNEALHRIEIDPGPAADIALTVDREAVIPGSDQTVTLHAAVTDAHGNVRPDDPVEIRIDQQALETEPADEGGVLAVISAPPAAVGIGALEIAARSGDLSRRLEVRLVGGPAQLARIEAPGRAVADGRTAVAIRVLLVGPTGLPASEVPNVHAEAGRAEDLRRTDDGWWSLSYVPDRSRTWHEGVGVVEVSRGPAQARARIDLEPPAPWLTLSLAGGFQTNLRSFHGGSGRLELGSRIRLSRGWVEIAALTGVGYGRSEDEVELGETRLGIWQVPVSAGFGYGALVRNRVGIDVVVRGGALVLFITERTSFQPETERVVVAPLVEGSVGLSVRIWRGELVTRLGFAYATGPEGSGISGNLMGLLATIGYRLFVM
jgi:hypothetical protein